jgi:RiboL-PSP-HEPN
MRITSTNVARAKFYQEIRKTTELLGHHLLTDVFPPSNEHNVGSRILRRGLMIAAFSSLEGYMEDRLEELYVSLCNSRLSYTHFGDELKRFLAVDSLVGLVNKMSFVRKPDRQGFAEDSIRKIKGLFDTPPIYTAMGFSPKGSNVARDDISNAIKALGCARGWYQLTDIARILGSSRMDLGVEYDGLVSMRNRAAHNPDANIPTSDMIGYMETITIVGLSFDILNTVCVAAYLRGSDIDQIKLLLESPIFAIRFIDSRSDGTWVERIDSARRARRVYANERDARENASQRTDDRFLVVRDSRLIPIELV